MIKQTVNYFIKFNKKDIKKLYRNQKKPKIFYRKGIGVLSEIILGNIEKERSKLKEPDKGNK